MRDGMMTDRTRVWLATLLLLLAATADAQPAFQELLYDLQSPREATRVKAARAIALSGYPDAASALVPLLADRADAVQLEAIDALVGLALASAPEQTQPTPSNESEAASPGVSSRQVRLPYCRAPGRRNC